jgi:hypothetical protein
MCVLSDYWKRVSLERRKEEEKRIPNRMCVLTDNWQCVFYLITDSVCFIWLLEACQSGEREKEGKKEKRVIARKWQCVFYLKTDSVCFICLERRKEE